MTGILKVDQWKDSGDNALMTSDGAGVLTANAGITIPLGATITNNGTASGFPGERLVKLYHRGKDLPFKHLSTGSLADLNLSAIYYSKLYFFKNFFYEYYKLSML
jgi:hypothetical protein